MGYITELPDNKDKPFGGAYSVYDQRLIKERNKIIIDFAKNNYKNEDVKQEYFYVYKRWMNSNNNLLGLSEFKESCFTQGTTEAFYQFYTRYRHKRLRLAHGEYFFHQMMSQLWFKNSFKWLEEDEIKEGDVLLISVPFSDTGNTPNNLEEILLDCDKKKVPVMLDLAYINLATNFEINLNHPSIEYVVTSLSKVFPVQLHRIGLRLQRQKFEDQIYVVNEYNHNYINILSIYLGLKMMQSFPSDWTYSKYRDLQIQMCEKYDLTISPCVYFGIDNKNKYSEYNRGNDTNRLCFSRIWDGRMKEPNTVNIKR